MLITKYRLTIMLLLISFGCEEEKEISKASMQVNSDGQSNHIAHIVTSEGIKFDFWIQRDSDGTPQYLSDISIKNEDGDRAYVQLDAIGRLSFAEDPSGYSIRFNFYLEGDRADVTLDDGRGNSRRGIIDLNLVFPDLYKQSAFSGIAKEKWAVVSPFDVAILGKSSSMDWCTIIYDATGAVGLYKTLQGVFNYVGCISIIGFDILTFPDIVSSVAGCIGWYATSSVVTSMVLDGIRDVVDMARDCDYEDVDLGDDEPPVEPPTTGEVELGAGEVHITLSWDNATDVDLHVTDPNDEEIYYAHSTSQSGGELDVDDKNGYGPENIYWQYGNAPEGQYIVEVVYYDSYERGPSNYEVVVRYGTIIREYSGTLTSDDERDHITTFTYTGGTSSTETVSTPSTPSGNSSGNTNTSYSYSTAGASSNEGHSIQYRFDWGGGNYSSWSSSASASHSWSSAGTYSVEAQARCASHTSIVSSWSSSRTVTISGASSTETVSTPSTPSGNSSGNTNTSYSYSTGGASSSLGHSIQYRFDWGDGSYSSWSSSASTSHSWSSAGTKSVKAQARCSSHTSIVSSWSSSKSVTISVPTETISTPSTPSGNSSGTTGTTYYYSTGGASSSLGFVGHSIQYRFDWGDGSYSSWSSSSTSISHSWSSAGTKSVKAQARCSSHTSVVSSWSSSKTVTISDPTEVLYAPSWPQGPTYTGSVNASLSFTAGGAVSNLGHSLQYRFDWGDGSYSNWSTATTSTISSSHSWSSAGTYSIKAQARCASHTSLVSSWSNSSAVTITQ